MKVLRLLAWVAPTLALVAISNGDASASSSVSVKPRHCRSSEYPHGLTSPSHTEHGSHHPRVDHLDGQHEDPQGNLTFNGHGGSATAKSTISFAFTSIPITSTAVDRTGNSSSSTHYNSKAKYIGPTHSAAATWSAATPFSELESGMKPVAPLDLALIKFYLTKSIVGHQDSTTEVSIDVSPSGTAIGALSSTYSNTSSRSGMIKVTTIHSAPRRLTGTNIVSDGMKEGLANATPSSHEGATISSPPSPRIAVVRPSEVDTRDPHCAQVCDTYWHECTRTKCRGEPAYGLPGELSQCWQDCVTDTCKYAAEDAVCSTLCGYHGKCGSLDTIVPFLQGPDDLIISGMIPAWPETEVSISTHTGMWPRSSSSSHGVPV